MHSYKVKVCLILVKKNKLLQIGSPLLKRNVCTLGPDIFFSNLRQIIQMMTEMLKFHF